MRDQLNAGAISETTQTLKTLHNIHSLSHYNKLDMLRMIMKGLKLPQICPTGEENLKKPHPGNLSRPGIEPGPAAWQARMLPPATHRWAWEKIKLKNFSRTQFRKLRNQTCGFGNLWYGITVYRPINKISNRSICQCGNCEEVVNIYKYIGC